MPIKIVRPFNTYGPRQSARAIIPTVITQLLSGNNTLKLGNIAPTRDFTFVKDTARGFYEIFKSQALYGEVTNIGMNHEISIEHLGILIAELMQKELHFETDKGRVRPDKSEVERLWCDNKKILEQTKWKPMYDLRTGLTETIRWITKYLDSYKPDLYIL
jgi:nucleoside-diphosphate-sugar epimerase